MNALNLSDLAFPDGEPRRIIGYISVGECSKLDAIFSKYAKKISCPINLELFQPFAASQIWRDKEKEFLRTFMNAVTPQSKSARLDLNVLHILGKIARNEIEGDVLAYWD